MARIRGPSIGSNREEATGQAGVMKPRLASQGEQSQAAIVVTDTSGRSGRRVGPVLISPGAKIATPRSRQRALNAC